MCFVFPSCGPPPELARSHAEATVLSLTSSHYSNPNATNGFVMSPSMEAFVTENKCAFVKMEKINEKMEKSGDYK